MLCRLTSGINRFEASIAGLGGCFTGAAGNTAMEDAINLFESIEFTLVFH